mgnify:CR=1 FL=1
MQRDRHGGRIADLPKKRKHDIPSRENRHFRLGTRLRSVAVLDQAELLAHPEHRDVVGIGDTAGCPVGHAMRGSAAPLRRDGDVILGPPGRADTPIEGDPLGRCRDGCAGLGLLGERLDGVGIGRGVGGMVEGERQGCGCDSRCNGTGHARSFDCG